jgi:hypothetical protein
MPYKIATWISSTKNFVFPLIFLAPSTGSEQAKNPQPQLVQVY